MFWDHQLGCVTGPGSLASSGPKRSWKILYSFMGSLTAALGCQFHVNCWPPFGVLKCHRSGSIGRRCNSVVRLRLIRLVCIAGKSNPTFHAKMNLAVVPNQLASTFMLDTPSSAESHPSPHCVGLTAVGVNLFEHCAPTGREMAMEALGGADRWKKLSLMPECLGNLKTLEVQWFLRSTASSPYWFTFLIFL